MQLYRKRIMILERNAVGKHELGLQRVAVIGLIKSFHAYLNTFRNDALHFRGV
jgi:hypothetical protein